MSLLGFSFVGTTAAVRMVTTAKNPAVPDGLWGYRVDAGHHLLGGATSEGGNIFRWVTDTLNLTGLDVEGHLSRAQPDGHGLTVLPLLAGERSPGWASHATGTITGLRLSTTPLDLMQAALEGVALRLGIIADQLGPLVEAGAAVYAGGGAVTASPAWTQIITNALNRPFHLVAETKATARG
ncbi:MAG: FGGY-family carbohydrate kinase, partial [Anaerolineae bacterium]|nr:FGGY-family carbohydrate kinase [Anaerolineae bacterium]